MRQQVKYLMAKKAMIMLIMLNMDNQGKKDMMLIITINIINNSNFMTRTMLKLNHHMILTIQNNKINLQNPGLEVLNQMVIRQTNMQTKNIITNIINSSITQAIKELQVSSHLLTMQDTINSNSIMAKLLVMDKKMLTMIKVNSNNNHLQQMIMQADQMENLINEI